jgi:hypothetical protein
MFPENRRASFRRDDRVVGILEHQHAVSDADTEGATRPSFANDHRDNGRAQGHHLAKIHRDRFRDVALFSADSRVCARSIDHRNERQTELLRQPHEPQGLAVTLRIRAAEVPLKVLLQLAALLVTNDHAFAPVDRRKAARHRAVLRKQPVPVQFDVLSK